MKDEICLVCSKKIKDIYETCENCGSKWNIEIITTIDKTLKVLFIKNKNLKEKTYRTDYLNLYKKIEETIPSEIGTLASLAIGTSINSLVSKYENNLLSFLEHINEKAIELSQEKVQKSLGEYKDRDKSEGFAGFVVSLILLVIASWSFQNLPTSLVNEGYLINILFYFFKWILIYPALLILLILGIVSFFPSLYLIFAPPKKGEQLRLKDIESIENEIEKLRRKVVKKIPLFKKLLTS